MNKDLKRCHNCKSELFYIKEKSGEFQRELYCFNCDSFIKYTTKVEIYSLIEKNQIYGGDER